MSTNISLPWPNLESPETKLVLKDFKNFLYHHHFPSFYRQMLLEGYQIIPFPTRTNVDTSEHIFHSFEKLFFRAGSINKKVLLQHFGNLGKRLLKVGILGEKHQSAKTAPLNVFSYFRLINNIKTLLLVPYKKFLSHNVYLGADSLSLARNIYLCPNLLSKNKQGLKILDLFTGTGIQLFHLINILQVKHGVGVDVLSDAIHCAQLNATINDCEDRTTFLQGDLTQNNVFTDIIKDYHSFDIITANPPILPEPTQTKHKLYTYGGPDGLDLVRAILPQCESLLSNMGVANILACSLGDYTKPFFLEELPTLLNKETVSYQVVIIKKLPIELDAYYRTSYDPEQFSNWINFYKNQSASYWYRMIIYIAKNPHYFPNNQLNLARSSFEKPIGAVDLEDIKTKTKYITSVSNIEEIWDFIFKTTSNNSDLTSKELAYQVMKQFPSEFVNIGAVMRFVGLIVERENVSPYLERFTW